MRDADNLGYIVHHKSYIDANNIYNPEITLNFENLELLCLDCHNKEHHGTHEFTLDGEILNEDRNILELAGVYRK